MKKFWTPEEREKLIELYPNNYTRDVCRILNRSSSSVNTQAYLLGLKKSEEFMKMELSKQADRLKVVGRKHQFKKGTIPPNKGVKMSDTVKEKVKHTFFSKGHEPHNTKYDGYERISKDGYVEVRIRKGKFVIKHRHLWEQAYGEIPKGMKLMFKDGNKQNITIENLEIISEPENAKRNRQLSHTELSDGYLAAIMSVRKKELRPLLLQQPQLLELKRSQLKLLRICRKSQSNQNQEN